MDVLKIYECIDEPGFVRAGVAEDILDAPELQGLASDAPTRDLVEYDVVPGLGNCGENISQLGRCHGTNAELAQPVKKFPSRNRTAEQLLEYITKHRTTPNHDSFVPACASSRTRATLPPITLATSSSSRPLANNLAVASGNNGYRSNAAGMLPVPSMSVPIPT